jgi:hypothetical protein
VPAHERHLERAREVLGELRLASAWLAAHE